MEVAYGKKRIPSRPEMDSLPAEDKGCAVPGDGLSQPQYLPSPLPKQHPQLQAPQFRCLSTRGDTRQISNTQFKDFIFVA